MPSILNSDDGVVSGSSGLKTTGGNDGILVFQKNGTETARINTDNQIVAAAGTASLPIYSTTGDLNTGIYFPGADRIGFAEGGVQVGEFDASGNFQFNSGYGSVATAYGCRAWVNFNGTGTVAIRASGNVTSITDQGTGRYSVNMTNGLPDTNYAFVGSAGPNSSNPNAYFTGPNGDYALNATTFTFDIRNDGATLVDQSWVCVAVFR